ncbi:ead/Ea22-like family protein [Klebsiella quasipneumoniae]|uniref:ead/Ea22-like family protein n=1 Tax=Klebsiella quasipneumoniae TaxID=1463165 RepID=UPI00256ED12B|nr:ead/Ea22-like family protein [Klebsiella quasipneumoniae]MDL5478932.1 ead/Ea22-like family protein [Klebsiella quasipneumoniae]
MTTDITELAQSLKAAAENAIGAHERLAAYPYGEIIDISQHEGEQIDIDITDLNEFNKEANPVNILALVEALEKAQQRISRLESRSVKLPKAMSIEGGAYCSAHAHYDSDGDYYDRTDVEEMLSAAGIKVEAER